MTTPTFGSNVKPAKGSALLARRARKQQRDAHERNEKAAVRARDGFCCRWPRCEFKTKRLPLEVAHILGHKGWGGNPANDRSERHRMMLLCQAHHQGDVSLHSGDLKIEPQTALGTDGRCDFYAKDKAGRWQCVASEKAIGISVARGTR